MMDNDNSLNKRPTFKRALRNISITSIFITMMLIWLLLSVTSVLTLKQYAQKNLALTAATMTYSLEMCIRDRYMRGLTNMALDDSALQGFFGVDRSDRDPQHARAAFSDFSKLVRGYPNSQYTTDATKRLVFLKDRLAKYEYSVAEYYTERGAWVAVVNRVEGMLRDYPDTQATVSYTHLVHASQHERRRLPFPLDCKTAQGGSRQSSLRKPCRAYCYKRHPPVLRHKVRQ